MASFMSNFFFSSSKLQPEK